MPNRISVTIEQTAQGFVFSRSDRDGQLLIAGGTGRKHLREAYQMAAMAFLELALQTKHNDFTKPLPTPKAFGAEALAAVDSWYDHFGMTAAQVGSFYDGARSDRREREALQRKLADVDKIRAAFELLRGVAV